MVHNGIEYGIMAAYAEGLNVLAHANVGSEAREEDAETTPLREPQYYQYDLDLPDVAACIAPRPLLLLNSVDHARRRLETDRVEEAHARTRAIYAAAGAEMAFTVQSPPPQHEAWRRELGLPHEAEGRR